MKFLVGGVFLLLASILQATLAWRFSLLAGSVDLVLLVLLTWMLQAGNRADWRWGLAAGLMLGLSSALPIWVLLAAYVGAAGLAQLLETRIWKSALFTLLGATLMGSLLVSGITMLYLWLSASPMDLGEAFNLVALPTALLNLLLVLPINAFVTELTKLVVPSRDIP